MPPSGRCPSSGRGPLLGDATYGGFPTYGGCQTATALPNIAATAWIMSRLIPNLPIPFRGWVPRVFNTAATAWIISRLTYSDYVRFMFSSCPHQFILPPHSAGIKAREGRMCKYLQFCVVRNFLKFSEEISDLLGCFIYILGIPQIHCRVLTIPIYKSDFYYRHFYIKYYWTITARLSFKIKHCEAAKRQSFDIQIIQGGTSSDFVAANSRIKRTSCFLKNLNLIHGIAENFPVYHNWHLNTIL